MLKRGDRVRYRGWRGDSGTGTVVEVREDRIKVFRDFSADLGVWFYPGRNKESVELLTAKSKLI